MATNRKDRVGDRKRKSGDSAHERPYTLPYDAAEGGNREQKSDESASKRGYHDGRSGKPFDPPAAVDRLFSDRHVSEEDSTYVAGFAEGEMMTEGSFAERGVDTILTNRQQQLREILLTASEEQLAQSLETGSYSVEDFFEVALDSLKRSNAIAERMLAESAEYRRQIERWSQQIDASQRETDRKLAELLGNGR
jgi:hypothetical protein